MARSANPVEAYSDSVPAPHQMTEQLAAGRKPHAAQPIQILTPLDAITAGINLLYAMDGKNGRGADYNRTQQPITDPFSSNLGGSQEEREAIGLPKIDPSFSASPRELYNQWSQ